MSKSTVARYFALFGIQPHRSKSFKLSTDPFFVEKVRDVVGLYLNPPDPAPDLMARLTILIGIGGGLAVLLGGLVVLAAMPMATVLLVAMFTVHLPYGFSSIKLIAVTDAGAQFGPPGYECTLLYLACLATLVLAGPGPFAIDNYLK